MPPTLININAAVRERYVLAAALLKTLDRVRGEPTTYGLDQEAPGTQTPFEIGLTRKFLDSFALVCAIGKGGSFVSAACLEDGSPDKTTIRIASNDGFEGSTLIQLRRLTEFLSSIANEASSSSIELLRSQVLRQIVEIDRSRIIQYAKQLRKADNMPEETQDDLAHRLSLAAPRFSEDAIRKFVDWFSQVSSIMEPTGVPDLDELTEWVDWAQQARMNYLGLFKAAFAKSDKSLPKWTSYIIKLGRYGFAAQILVEAAIELPHLFTSITVEAITAPLPVEFEPRLDSNPLETVLSRVPEIIPAEVIPRLAAIWGTDDPEKYFRAECTTELAAHAELQLVNFYDDNPHLRPRSPFIGVSKKSCYLCHTFIQMNHDEFKVSSCHQKVYLSIPPPVSSSRVYKRLKSLTLDLAKRMEGIAREDIQRRLGMRRSHIPPDSTAGTSLPGMNGIKYVPPSRFRDVTDIYSDIDDKMNGAPLRETTETFNPRRAYAESEHSSSSTIQNSGWTRINANGSDAGDTERGSPTPSFSPSMASMVLHVKMQRDEFRQDIVMIESVLDPSTGKPSWAKLVEFLNPNDEDGVALRDSDHLWFNDRIRVRNERQLQACLQHLMNAGSMNADVLICERGSTPRVEMA